MDKLYSTLNSVLAERYTTNATRIRELAAPLTNAQFWQNPFSYGNSLGHLVLHLTGNELLHRCANRRNWLCP